MSDVLGNECYWSQFVVPPVGPQAVPIPAFAGEPGPSVQAEAHEAPDADVLPFAPAADRSQRRRALLDAFLGCCRQRLRDAWQTLSQAPLRAALEDRGVTNPAELPIGLLAELPVLKQELLDRGFSPAQIKDARVLADERLPGRICGPICDLQGSTVSVWAWDPRPRRPRYLYLRRNWTEQVPVAGLETALGWTAQHGALVLVEDILDGVVLQARGFRHVAAIGGPAQELTKLRFEQLSALGICRVVLALDRMRTHPGGILAALAHARHARMAPEVFVVPPYRFAPYSGPIGVLRHRGPDALSAILEHRRIPARRYWAQSVRLPLVPYHFMRADESAVSANPPEPPPVSAAVSTLRPAASWCELHGCAQTECFCFD